MHRIYRIALILLAILLYLLSRNLRAQEAELQSGGATPEFNMLNPVGKEFWLCFQKNFKNNNNDPLNDLHLELFIASEFDANVTVEIKSVRFYESFRVEAGVVKNLKIDPLAQIQSSEVVEEKSAVHITSDQPISVYGLNRRFQTTDTYLGLPKKTLGKEYRAICYTVSDGFLPQFAVVATEDSTSVEITPTARTSKHPANKPYEVELNQGDVYQVTAFFDKYSSCDLSGSTIKANKKISVFSGHPCAYVPPTIFACNHLVEQIPPTDSWGKHFYIGHLKPRSKYTYRVLADKNETKVFENDSLIRILNAGEYFDNISSRNIQITATKPVLVSQYSQGYKNGDSIGDPMMLLISPTQQFLKEYRFATPVNGSWEHYINVVAPTKSISTMMLNGDPINPIKFERLGISRYSIAFIRVPFGTHVIEGEEPFGMYSYGFGYDKDAFDAYGAMGGQSFFEYVQKRDSLPPSAEIIPEDSVARLILRDDRNEDTGIKDIEIIRVEGLNLNIPEYETGAPQVATEVLPTLKEQYGYAVVRAVDVENNEVLYTVCYNYDPLKYESSFVLSEGYNPNCAPDPGWDLGLFGKLSFNAHDLGFSSTGDLSAQSEFSGASSLSGYGGFYIGREINLSIRASARVSFENVGGVFSAPDTITSHVFDTSAKKLKLFQEEYEIAFKPLFVNIALAGEYSLNSVLYLAGGVNFAIPISKEIKYSRKIVAPENYAYPNGERSKDAGADKLESISGVRLGVFAGAGGRYPIYRNISAFAEAGYLYNITDVVDDGQWKLGQFSIIAGVRINLR